MTRIWANCPVCEREALHEVDGEGMTCLACGAVYGRGGTKEDIGGGTAGGTAVTAHAGQQAPPLETPPLQNKSFPTLRLLPGR